MFRYRTKSRRARSRHYHAHKESARTLVLERLAYFNQFYGHSIGRISIRNQKTRWGSCSKKGNLNFNYRIALLSPVLADYVIVHELCHIQEFNHGEGFWALVEKTLPDHVVHRRALALISLR